MRRCDSNAEICRRVRKARSRLCAAALALLCLAAPRLGLAQNFTIANNVFPSTPVGQSTTQSVTLTLNAALALQSIAIPAGFNDYALGAVSGCTIDGATVNPAGTACTVPVTYTPVAPGSTASPMLARTAPLFVTDIESGNPVTYNFGLTGAATGPILALSAGTFTRYAGQADANATDPGDNGLGVVSPGYAGDGGPANEAQFAFNVRTQNEEGSSPMAVDSAGNLHIADGGNYVIRRVDAATGNIALYAGEPGVVATDNYDGGGLQVVDGVPATQSPLAPPYGLMFDAAGNLYFLEQYSTYYGGGTGAVLREVNAATGIISTIAGSNIWYYPYVPPYAGQGTCADPYHCGDGGPAAAAFLAAPIAMTMDGAGNIYLYFPYGNIREIDASTGIINTIATPSVGSQDNAGYGITMGADGNLYVANYDPNPTSVSANATEYLTQVNPSTGATAIAGGNSPPTVAGCQQTGTPFNGWLLDFYVGGLTSDGAGNLYDFFNYGCNANLYAQQYESWMSLNSGLGYELYLYQGGYGDYGPGTIYNVVDGYYFFNYITNTGAAPDNQGNFYMMSSDNQVAKLSTSAAALPDYGSQGDGTTSAAQSVVVWNMGNAPLTATVTIPVDYVLSPSGDASACTNPFELAAGQYCDLDISFSPTSNGNLDETATITDGNGQQAQVQLYGEGGGTPIPRGIFSPQSYNFGSQPANVTTNPQPIAFTNGGGATLTITSISITGANASYFAETNNCPATLATGASCTINVTFTPSAANSYSAALSVADNTTLTPQTAALSGTGTAAPLGTFSPASYNFGSEPANQTTNPQPIAFTNGGGATLTITSISITGANASNFAETNNCPATLAAGASCTINVTFTPSAANSYSAALSVADNTTLTPQTAALGGTGTAAPLGTFSPASYNFGSEPANQTTNPQPIAFTNSGGATLNITSISITGANASNFAETNNCPATLAAGANCIVNVSFTPAAATSYAATLSITDNATDSPETAALSGTGVVPLTGNISINETIHLSDAPALAESTLLAIGEVIHVNDAGSGTTLNPSTLLSIGETINLNDAGAGTTLNPSTLLPINETIHVADAESIPIPAMIPTITWPTPAPIVYGTPLGAAQLDPTASAPGSFTFTPTAGTVLTAGPHTLKTSFIPANPTLYTTASASTTLTVNQAPLTLTANNASRAYGAANPAFTGTITGGVNGDILVEDFSTTATELSPPGSYAIVPSVAGTNVASYAVTADAGTLTVGKADSTVKLISSLTTLSAGDSVTFTVTVKSTTTGTPTGSVNLLSGATTLGSANLAAGSATFSTTQLAPGDDSITAVYSGDADFNGSTSAIVSEHVSSFTLALGAGSGTVFPGELAVVTLTASPSGGAFANPIALSVNGLPAGATANFDPATITPGTTAQKSTLTIQTASESAANGSMHSFGLRTGIAFGLLVPLLGPRRIRRAGKRSLRLMLFALVAFAAATAIGGCTGGGFFVQPPQTYSITVTATSGPVTQSSVFKLTVE